MEQPDSREKQQATHTEAKMSKYAILYVWVDERKRGGHRGGDRERTQTTICLEGYHGRGTLKGVAQCKVLFIISPNSSICFFCTFVFLFFCLT